MQARPEPETRNTAPPPAGRARRRLALRLIAIIAGLVAGASLLLASPAGRSFVLRTVAASLRTRLGVEARSGRLEYRVVDRGVTLHGVSLTQNGATGPFLRAERVDIDLASGILLGSLSLRRLEVARPEIVLDPTTWIASTDGSTAPASFPAFDIQRVDLRDLSLMSGTPAGTQVSVRGLALSLDGDGPGRLRGQAVVAGGMFVGGPDAGIRIDRARADLSLTGSSLSFSSVTIESPAATARATARADISRGDIEAEYDARIDASALRQGWPDAPPVAGEVTVTGTIGGTLDQPVVTLDGRGERLQWRDVNDGALSVSLRWSNGGLAIERAELSSGTLGVRLRGRGHVAGPGARGASALSADARAIDLRRLARVIGAPALPAMPVTLAADLTWPGAVPRPAAIEGTLQLDTPGIDGSGGPVATLEAKGEGGRWVVRQRGTLPGETRTAADLLMVVDASALSRTTLEGRAIVASVDAPALLRDLERRGLAPGELVRALGEGRVAADATLAGTLASPRIDARVTADALAIAGITGVHAEAQARIQGRSVVISRMTVEAAGNRIDGRGTATLGAGPIDLTVEGRLGNPAALAGRLPAGWRPTGDLAFSATMAGSLLDPRLTARLSGSGLEVHGVRADSLDGRATFERGLLSVSDLRLTRGVGWLRLDGEIDRRLQHMTVRGHGEKLSLVVHGSNEAEVLRLENLSLDIDAAGAPRQPAGHVSATGHVAMDGRGVGPVTLSATSAGGILQVDVGVPDHRAKVTGSIALESGWPFQARGTLDGTQIAPLLAVLGPAVAVPEASGSVTASVTGAGRLDRPAVSSALVTLSALDAQVRGRPLTLLQPGRVRFEEREAIVEEPVRLALGGFSIGLIPSAGLGGGMTATLEGRIEEALGFLPPDLAIAAWQIEGPLQARVSRVPISWAVPSWLANRLPVDSSPAEAAVTARANLNLTRVLPGLAGTQHTLSAAATVAMEARATAPRLEDVEGTLDLETSELAIGADRVSQVRPARLRLAGGRLDISELVLTGPGSQFSASGAIGLLAGSSEELRLDGTSALSIFRAIVPGADGEASVQLRLSGPPAERRASASVDLKDVTLIEPERQLALAGLSGTLTFEDGVIQTRGLRGQLNGGELTIEGAVAARAGVAAPRPLKIEGRGLFVEIPRGLRSQLDTTLTWENASAGSRVSGQVSIASDTYREPITALAALAASLSNVTPGRARQLPPWIAATALDVRVTSVGPLVVDQSVLKIEMVPDVRLSGTIGRPSLNGQVAIQDDGRIQAGGRTYRLTESRLDFSPATGLLPRLNVIGETRVSSYLVTLRITGPANEIETNFSSDPPLSERDVRSLLITGQISDPSGGSTASDRFAVGAVSGDVLGVAGQFVGLDSVRVGSEDLDLVSSDVNPATRLTVSKRLGSRFELVISENLEESQSTWIVIYRPVTGYEFRLSSEDNTTQAIEFRQEITFGPGVSSHARVKSVSLVPDRVRSVTLAGEPGFPADLVLRGTKIRTGDRFDFREWLDDRDRIARFYRNRGYFTVRIVPTRTTGEAGGTERLVDLQYRITRGRRTLLEVTGYPADDDLIERLRQAWSSNVLLDLLDDSLIRAARERLVDDGRLRARVEVEVDQPEPGSARARVRIEPGPRTDARRFAFSGNQVIASDLLQDLATSPQLEAEPWKDPAPLIREIQAAYSAKGHLAARAIADPVVFSNGEATLPIRIEEGPPAHVAALQLTGVAPERQSGALGAVALPVGSPFASGMGSAGRMRLERYYRDLGYRDVRVEVAVANLQQGPAIGLTYRVQEGPLHVVESVEVTGVESTRPSLVTNAVRLAPGEPAGAAAAAATERRLYDLGTFRRAELRFEPEPARPEVPGVVPVKAIVLLEEARRFQLRYGVELSSEYNSALSQRTNSWGVAADIRDRNFLGRGLSLGGGLRVEPDLRSARALFSVPKLAQLPIRTNLYMTGRGEEDISDQQVRISDDEYEVSIEQRWRVGRSVEYSWGYSANWRDTQLTSASRAEPLKFAGTLASLNGAAVIDRRDSFFDAKRGWFGSVSLQWGRQRLGSDLDYLRTLARGSYYQPLGPIVLAGNVRWGRLLPLGGVAPLTVFDLFFNAGGTESVRGYSQDRLSAYEFFGAPLGGTKLLVTNAELRAPLFWRLGGVLFADAGNTFTESQPIRFRDLAVGLGVGLRINTPLAPVRIDWGYPRSLGESGFRWHFSIGQMF